MNEKLKDWVTGSWSFDSQPEEEFCIACATFCDSQNMSRDDFMNLFPVTLRVLKIKSKWSGMDDQKT